MSEKKLGRGLDFLISGENQLEGDEVIEVEIERVHANRFQPRSEFDESALRELATSLTNHGFLQPIMVRPDGTRYEIVAGERRWRAAKLAGFDTVPALVRSLKDDRMLEFALIENIQREDLDPIEKGKACRQLMQQHGLTQDEVARQLGKDRSTVANLMRLLELPGQIQDLVHHGLLGMGHARVLLRVKEGADQLRIAQRMIKEGLSVRRAEEIVADELKAMHSPTTRKKGQEKAPHIVELEETLAAALGSKVRILLQRGRQDKGKMVVEFYSEDDFQRLITLLAPQRSELP